MAELPEFIDPPEKGEEENNRPQVADSQRILKTLNDMAEAGLIKRDLLLTAIVRYKVANHSVLALEKVCELETALLKLLQEEDPDAEGWLHFSPRRLNQRLIDQGFACVPESLMSILKSERWLCIDARLFNQKRLTRWTRQSCASSPSPKLVAACPSCTKPKDIKPD